MMRYRLKRVKLRSRREVNIIRVKNPDNRKNKTNLVTKNTSDNVIAAAILMVIAAFAIYIILKILGV